MLKILSCASFGSTGSSAVTDFLSEFSCVKVVGGSQFEFTLLHENDGIFDLENALIEGHRLKTDLAIKRFISLIKKLGTRNPSGPNYEDYFNGHFLEYTYDYLDSLGVVSWNKGYWHRVFEVTPIKKNTILGKREKASYILKKFQFGIYEGDGWRPSYGGFCKQYYCHISKESFKEKTKVFLSRLFLELAGDYEYLLFDQLFPSNVNNEYLDYFDFAKVIVVDRDPRDLFFLNKVFWGLGYIPFENVNTFVKWYRITRENVSENKNVLHIKFEDMIYNFEKSKSMICDFIGMNISLHDKPETKLIVSKSIKNTQVFKKFLLTDEHKKEQMVENLGVIEKELKDFLYPFPKTINDIQNQDATIEDVYREVEKKGILSIVFYLYAMVIDMLRFVYQAFKKIRNHHGKS